MTAAAAAAAAALCALTELWHGAQARNNTMVILNKRQENRSRVRRRRHRLGPLRTLLPSAAADTRWIYLLWCLCMPMSAVPANQ